MLDLDRLRREDRRQLERMALAAQSDPEAVAAEVIAAYFRLMRAAPACLPNDPLARRALAARGGSS